jgi:hypothetical protein
MTGLCDNKTDSSGSPRASAICSKREANPALQRRRVSSGSRSLHAKTRSLGSRGRSNRGEAAGEVEGWRRARSSGSSGGSGRAPGGLRQRAGGAGAARARSNPKVNAAVDGRTTARRRVEEPGARRRVEEPGGGAWGSWGARQRVEESGARWRTGGDADGKRGRDPDASSRRRTGGAGEIRPEESRGLWCPRGRRRKEVAGAAGPCRPEGGERRQRRERFARRLVCRTAKIPQVCGRRGHFAHFAATVAVAAGADTFSILR